jgi:hypothetical protein
MLNLRDMKVKPSGLPYSPTQMEMSIFGQKMILEYLVRIKGFGISLATTRILGTQFWQARLVQSYMSAKYIKLSRESHITSLGTIALRAGRANARLC